MFNKLKQFKDMRSKAKDLQSQLAEIIIEEDHRGIKIVMDGNQKVHSISIPEGIASQELEKILPDIFNNAVKKVQREMVKKVQSQGGMDNLKW